MNFGSAPFVRAGSFCSTEALTMNVSKRRVVVVLFALIIVQLFAPFPEVVHEVIGTVLGFFLFVVGVHEIIQIIDAFKKRSAWSSREVSDEDVVLKIAACGAIGAGLLVVSGYGDLWPWGMVAGIFVGAYLAIPREGKNIDG
jgi:uncharacterized protein YhhL (DUF1145 family)